MAKLEPLHKDNDKHLTIRLSPRTVRAADKIVEKAWREELQVMGRMNPIRVKHSHVLKLAVEVGLELVLERLHEIQDQLPKD